VKVFPALQAEKVAEIPAVEARRGDGVAQGGPEVAEACAHEPPPLGLWDLRQGQGHVAQGDVAVPAVEPVGEAAEGAAEGACAGVGQYPQESLDRQVEAVFDAVADGAVLHEASAGVWGAAAPSCMRSAETPP
jgi:hypothetical protein